ncbi:MAG: neuraminidase (sialidase)-like protein [Opitutus sp.]|nr:neuraminidase (sialidase)-like protein [Opitutus sp.]
MRSGLCWHWLVALTLLRVCAAAEAPFSRGEFIIPPERVHNHGSCLVETPNGDLIVCWFHGTGERTADDCKIEGARWRRGAAGWDERFEMADTPAFPDTNCCMFIDPQQRLWLIWPTILDNHWESALLKYRRSDDYAGPGAPRWKWQDVIHVKPGLEFEPTVKAAVERFRPQAGDQKVQEFIDYALAAAGDKLKTRLGWMTRAHPFVLDGRRLIVPLYSDGFNFSLMAITDDWGATWHTSAPLVGDGNVQPSIVRRRDGSLYTMMRDNGRPPQRIQQASSFDRGETWTEVTDSALTDPGKGLEVIALANGHWIVVHNDTDSGRHSLCARVSDDEGKTWKWSRHLERDEPGPAAGSYSYPSLIQAKDGTVHVTYSYVFAKTNTAIGADARARETIKHRQFNEAWIMAGDR